MTTDYTELKKLAEAAYPTTEDMHPTGIALANIQRGAFAKGAEAMLCRAAASAPRAELTDERAAFEAWAELTASQAQGTCHDITGWYYFDDVTNDRWEAWQARAVLAQAAPVAGVPVGEIKLMGEIRHTVWNESINTVPVGAKLYAVAAPAAPVAAAVPAGWIRNTGKQPVANDVLVVIVNQTGFTDVAQASHFCWDIEGFEQDIVHFCVLPAAPAPVDGDAA